MRRDAGTFNKLGAMLVSFLSVVHNGLFRSFISFSLAASQKLLEHDKDESRSFFSFFFERYVLSDHHVMTEIDQKYRL